jgi:hypothetical protein
MVQRNSWSAIDSACRDQGLFNSAATHPTDEMRMAFTWNMENLAFSTCALTDTGNMRDTASAAPAWILLLVRHLSVMTAQETLLLHAHNNEHPV